MCWGGMEVLRETQVFRSSRLRIGLVARVFRPRMANLHGKLRGIDLQPLARMGYQHLSSHPETSPMEDYAALCDRLGGQWGGCD